MIHNRYNNFVRPSPEESVKADPSSISGEEARKIYLEEIKEARDVHTEKGRLSINRIHSKKIVNIVDNISNKDLFLCVQNNDIQMLISVLDAYPDKIYTTDEFGWSLLMIACQANSIDTVKELLKRGVDISVRDKGGNSARSLVIKNRNVVLADILLSHKTCETDVIPKKTRVKVNKVKSKVKEKYMCNICNKEFPDRAEHLSSTVHNISASKDKKIPTNYVIPETNRGYQIMLRVGWCKDSGLGPDGSGYKYPIKTVQKQDRKGLGLEKKRKQEEIKETVKNVNRKQLDRQCRNNKSMEINFRRQFY